MLEVSKCMHGIIKVDDNGEYTGNPCKECTKMFDDMDLPEGLRIGDKFNPDVAEKFFKEEE